MKKTLLVIIATLLAVSQGAWAQTVVNDEAALNNAIADAEGETVASIQLGADITLSAYLKIGESKNQTVVLDLCGHKLRRNLDAVDTNGHVIEVFGKGVLTVMDTKTGGEISGGRANNGGGICNYGTLHLDGGTIVSCLADNTGGGVKNNGTMTMLGGTILGCWGNDGGGIYNAEGANLTITGGVISGNTSKNGGGGIVNYGMAYIFGGTIHNNHATTRGGGIWNGGTMTLGTANINGNRADIDGGGIYNKSTLHIEGGTISGNTARTNGGGVWNGGSLTMQGYMYIIGNENADGTINNLYLADGKVIAFTGAISEDSSIGVSMENPGVFTFGYRTHITIANYNLFFPDGCYDFAVNTQGEGYLYLSQRKYFDCSWDEANRRVIHTVREIPADQAVDNICTPKYANGGNLDGEKYWFIADGTATIDNRIYCHNNVHIILRDNASLTLTHSLAVNVCDKATLFIHCQSYGTQMGKLVVTAEDNNAGIGSTQLENVGYIVIHGGNITAKGGSSAAGIGGGKYSNGSVVLIYDGKVDSHGGKYGAGIGGGESGGGGRTTIYKGVVEAHGGDYAAGIGCSWEMEGFSAINGGTIIVNDGSVHAYGGRSGAGIGSGYAASGGTITINGGEIYAYGGSEAAGIGLGDNDNYVAPSASIITINNGMVYAYGGKLGAGIGGGGDCNGGTITITGGIVNAWGGSEAAGIGSGDEYFRNSNVDGGNITISGGQVMAYGGDYGAGIGGGQDADGGTITITGGEVYAKGGEDAAGIGSGEETDLFVGNIDGGTITISGGHVEAWGNDEGAAIGAGEDAASGNITITGGTIIAHGGDDTYAFKCHDDSDGANTLNLGDNIMVLNAAGEGLPATSRKTFLRENRDVIIQPCTHNGNGYTITDGSRHQLNSCGYCLMGGSLESHAFGSDSKCVCGLLGLWDDTDNTSALTKWNNTTQTVALQGRTLWKDYNWITLCLPFAVTDGNATDGIAFSGTPLQAAIVKALDSSSFVNGTLTLNFEDATTIEAGKPYLVKWITDDPDIENPVFTGVTVSNATAPVETPNVDFIGITSPVTLTGGDRSQLYLGDANTLCYPSTDVTINSFHAYFALKGGIEAGDLPNHIQAIVLNFGEETGIEVVNGYGLSVIGYGDGWFSLDGRRLGSQPAAAGLYIHRGRKVIIK